MSLQGLKESEIKGLRERFGENSLITKERVSVATIFFRNLKVR